MPPPRQRVWSLKAPPSAHRLAKVPVGHPAVFAQSEFFELLRRVLLVGEHLSLRSTSQGGCAVFFRREFRPTANAQGGYERRQCRNWALCIGGLKQSLCALSHLDELASADGIPRPVSPDCVLHHRIHRFTPLGGPVPEIRKVRVGVHALAITHGIRSAGVERLMTQGSPRVSSKKMCSSTARSAHTEEIFQLSSMQSEGCGGNKTLPEALRPWRERAVSQSAWRRTRHGGESAFGPRPCPELTIRSPCLQRVQEQGAPARVWRRRAILVEQLLKTGKFLTFSR